MSLILDQTARLHPKSVIDIGIGYGKWGLLLREQLDWNEGRLERADWATRIDGIEVFRYESPLHDWVYDEIRWGDVADLASSIEGYDLVLLSDVIEHIDKAAALALLHRFVATNRNVIVSTPLDFFEQEIAGNEHEAHVSHWSIDDFSDFTFDYDVAGGAAMVITLAGKEASQPTKRAARASRALYRIPGLSRRGAIVRVLKQLVPGS